MTERDRSYVNAAIYLQISFFSFFFLLIFQHVALFSCLFLFCLFFPRRSVPLIVACLFLFFFLLLSIPAFFPDPSRWCRVVMLKTAVYGNQVRFESLKNSAGTCTKSELCYIVTYVDSHLHICTYICRIIHSDTTIKTHEGKPRNEGRMKASLEKYSPLTLLQGFERVVQELHVRGCWRPNINIIFWPHCYDRHVVSFPFF